MPLTASADPPAFCSVTVCAVLWAPTVSEPNVSSPGWKLAKAGAGATISGKDNELPPPGVGLTTEICTVPGCAMSEAGIYAVSCVVLRRFVVRSWPSHFITEPGTKLAPSTLNIKPGPPAVTLELPREVATGTG